MQKIDLLYERALLFKKVRSFFEERKVVEVDTPILSKVASVDEHIDLISAEYGRFSQSTPDLCYLHSSPEYAMKRLLSEGAPDIYQLSHVFRDGECGPLHNPEFMMCEWYRRGFSLQEMIEETADFICLFLGKVSTRIYSYKELFLHFLEINPFEISEETLRERVKELLPEVDAALLCDTKDDILHLLMTSFIEPHLGKEELAVVSFYPPSQAALAKVRLHDGDQVAERFEIYFQGVELANGYYELQDAQEQLQRAKHANLMRVARGKNSLPIDMYFIQALERGLPECSGVAVGVDRLILLRTKKSSIREVLPLSWHQV